MSLRLDLIWVRDTQPELSTWDCKANDLDSVLTLIPHMEGFEKARF